MLSINQLIGFGSGSGRAQADSDVTGGQTFSASQTGGGYALAALFDDSGNTDWANGTDDTFWVQVHFSVAKAIWKYTVTSSNSADFDRMPITWTFRASNTGAFAGEEVTLDTQTSVPPWSQAEKRLYLIPNESDYFYYRLNGTAKTNTLGKVAEYVIAEMEMMAFD
jgi:hypothetical protein